jgi:putative oxidoreductase
VVTTALNFTTTVHVHVIYLHIPFKKYERSCGPPSRPTYEVDMRSVTLTRVAVIMGGIETTIQTVRDITLLIGRVVLGMVFIAHGWTKHTNGIEATADRFESWGVPAPTVSAYFATYLELIGGSALILGLMTPVAALLLCSTMIGAIFTAHADGGFSLRDNGYEYVLTLAAFCLVIAAHGSGKFGLDALWLRRFGSRQPVGRAVPANVG